MRPGLNINIIMHVDHLRETIDVGNSIIHEIKDDILIVAQIDPPISRTRLGQDIFVTFLDRDSGRPQRLGFPATVAGFINNYELSSAVKGHALVLRTVGAAEEYNLRMFFRLELPGGCGLTVSIDGRPVNLIDVSIGGARFSYERWSNTLKSGEDVALTMLIDTMAYSINGRVLRVWEPENDRIRKTIAMASIQFANMEAQVKNILARKIRDIERELRYKETDMGR